jgi:hypothetical protein
MTKQYTLEEPFTPLKGDTVATAFTCALCGGKFTHGRQVCGSCPLNMGCAILSCPHCGHSFPRKSIIVNAFQKIVKLIRRKHQ